MPDFRSAHDVPEARCLSGIAMLLSFDHRPQRLLDALAAFLGAPQVQGPGDPFARDIVVCANGGLGIRQAIADRLGVASGVELMLPGRFLWHTLGGLLDDVSAQSPFEPDVLRWVLLPLLAELAADPQLEAERLSVLHARFAAPGRASDEALLVLATQIAGQFSHLLNFRRPWLDAWARDERVAPDHDPEFARHEAWLSWLWRQTLTRAHRAARRHPFDRFADWLAQVPPVRQRERFEGLGLRRVAVFGMPAIAPEQLQLLGRMAAHIEMGFFVLDPCREFWQDLVSPRRLAAIRVTNPEEAWLFEQEPSVLAAWGRQHRDYLAQLRALEERGAGLEPVRVDEAFRDIEPGPPEDRLQALRQSLFLLSDRPWNALAAAPRAGPDRSLQVHACHGRTRQLEVLRDLLLDAFETMPDLRADDVLVFVPELDLFADAIDGVFADGRIPYAIDARAADPSELPASFVRLLDAAAGLDLETLRGLFDDALLLEALGLDADDAREWLDLIQRAGFRDDRAGAAAKHGLQSALDRLWLGLALPVDADDEPAGLGEVVAVPGLSLSTVDGFGRLLALRTGLERLADAGRERPDVLRWCEIAAREVNLWFAAAPAAGNAEGPTDAGESPAGGDRLETRRVALLDLLQSIAAQARAAQALTDGSAPQPLAGLDLAAFARVLREAVGQGRSKLRLRNSVTFGPPDALRGQGARVVVWLGLSEAAYPRDRTRLEFDLMARRPRFGDIDTTSVERGAFLDSLVACASRFIVLYDGRDLRSNEKLNPSVLVDELMAYVRARPGGETLAVVEHPLLAFSPRVFADSNWPAFDATAYRAAVRLAPAAGTSRTAGTPFKRSAPSDADASSARADSRGTASAAVESQADCVRILSRPAQAYLQRVAGIDWPRGLDGLSEAAPLDPGGDVDPEFLALAQRFLDIGLQRGAGRLEASRWRDLPELPAAAFGSIAAGRLADLWEDRRQRTDEHLAAGLVDSGLSVRRWRHAGRTFETAFLPSRDPAPGKACAQLIWSAYPMGAHAVIDAFVRHQVARLAFAGRAVETVWIGKDGEEFVLKSAPQVQPRADRASDDDAPGAADLLGQVFGHAARIVAEPLRLFPKTYLTWMRKVTATERARGMRDWDTAPSNRAHIEQVFERELAQDDSRVLHQAQQPSLEEALAESAACYRLIFEGVAR